MNSQDHSYVFIFLQIKDTAQEKHKQENINKYLTKKKFQIANNHMNRSTGSSAITESQFKQKLNLNKN